ncbi:G patch domain and ankyrin repeat-containing protein 1-like [Spea bombifrons]|uniref:G patch domain and ankyrin repeat-containing protein 1-like n=1 Tax=Spea bombifrons TaxID=233779 RepID=UPI00234982B0|nr:G patch domain and ankyrin repeat-containing protein 1-like [Spea bombifrons]
MNHPQLITFTRAREKSDFWENGEHSRKRAFRALESATTGEEARNFYESLLSTKVESSASKRPTKKRIVIKSSSNEEPPRTGSQGRSAACDHRLGHQLLKCSQDGDFKGLKRIKEIERCNINYRDGYYWTALMCAACGGRKEVVSYLLKRGAAWIGVCETQGKDALMLAQESGHHDIVRLLEESLRSHPEERTPRITTPETKHCEICKTRYQEDSVETHMRSTIHLFNMKKKLPPTYYAIPEHNVGFKMLLKEGWNRESGLGPEGTGRKFPVQTVLKRDQKGLGFQTDQKPKVTHFSANDTELMSF